MDCQENTTYLIKMVEYDKYRFKSKEKPKYVKKEDSYWVECRKTKTKNKNIKGVALENKIGQQNQYVLMVILKKSTF